jgi:hypothetical protein
MATAEVIVFMYLLNDSDNNNITYLGIKQLVCMQWSQLLFLDLCNNCHNLAYNNFGSVGAKQLSKINMPVLEKMELCNRLMT